jgi:hypothetical protein
LFKRRPSKRDFRTYFERSFKIRFGILQCIVATLVNIIMSS